MIDPFTTKSFEGLYYNAEDYLKLTVADKFRFMLAGIEVFPSNVVPSGVVYSTDKRVNELHIKRDLIRRLCAALRVAGGATDA
jgi:hypothetical protein